MFGELRGEFFIEPGVPRPRAGLKGLGLTEVDQVDDFLAVDAQGEGLPELLVGKHVAHLGVFVGHVQVNLHLLRAGSHQLNQAVAAFLHVLRQGRLVLQRVDMTLLNIELARQGIEHQRLDILGNAEVQSVDVGQLLTGLVDLPKISVALHHHPGDPA